jgi:hypothetical protein
MSSRARRKANRANARLSTGPRTEAGKQQSSQNALKHGLNASKPLVHPGENESFRRLEHNLHAQLLPFGALEEDLFAKLLHASWCLRRIRHLEEELFGHFGDPFTHPEAERQMNSYARHAARFERVYRNTLRDLRQLQTDRNLAVQATGSGPIHVTAVTDVEKLLKRTQQDPQKRPSKPEPEPDSGDFTSSQEELEEFIASHYAADGANSTAA